MNLNLEILTKFVLKKCWRASSWCPAYFSTPNSYITLGFIFDAISPLLHSMSWKSLPSYSNNIEMLFSFLEFILTLVFNIRGIWSSDLLGQMAYNGTMPKLAQESSFLPSIHPSSILLSAFPIFFSSHCIRQSILIFSELNTLTALRFFVLFSKQFSMAEKSCANSVT